jgi:peptidoglycan hydrolase CwlO-like protein
MSIIFVILAMITIIAFLGVTVVNFLDGEIAHSIGFLIVSVVIWVASFGAPYASLNSDVHQIINAEEYIQLEQEYASDLKAQLDDLPEVDPTLLNADTPIASLVDSIHESQKKIRERRVMILDSKRSIQERQEGWTSYVFWFYSDDMLSKAGFE